MFSQYGEIKNIHVNLDKKTNTIKGYALIEYESLKETEKVISNLNNVKIGGKVIKVSYAFKKV